MDSKKRKIDDVQETNTTQDLVVDIQQTLEEKLKRPKTRTFCMNDYSLEKEIVETLRKEEDTKFKRLFKGVERQYQKYLECFRKDLVTWILDIAEEERYHLTTTSLAVNLMDRTIKLFPTIPKDYFQLVSTTCIFIAAKCEECVIDSEVLKKLADKVFGIFKIPEIIKMETIILNTLQWDIQCISPSHFLECYQETKEKITKNGKEISYLEKNKIRDYSIVLVEGCLRETVFEQFSPSLVASSCILFSRKLNQVDQVWTTELESNTQYKDSDLSQCCQLLDDMINSRKLPFI